MFTFADLTYSSYPTVVNECVNGCIPIAMHNNYYTYALLSIPITKHTHYYAYYYMEVLGCDNWFIKTLRVMAGEPNSGIHSHRLLGFATVDVLLTVLLVVTLWMYGIGTLVSITVSVLLLTILSHWFFCVPTALNTLLGMA